MASDNEVTLESVDDAAASRLGVWLLMSYLENADPGIRRHAALRLQEMMDPRAVNALVSVLGDTDAHVASAAAAALGSLRDPRAVEPLRAALDHDSEDVRVAATQAIADIGQGPRSRKELKEAKKHARKEVKKTLKDAKKQLAEDVVADVARMTHATVRFEPPNPGFTGTVALPDVCAWCGERAPSATVEREIHQKSLPWTQGGMQMSITVNLQWTVTIPYCDECLPRAQSRPAPAARRNQPCDAVYWGGCQVTYVPTELVGTERVHAWVESLELVFLNADVARRLDPEYRNLELQTWTGGLWRGGFQSSMFTGTHYYGYPVQLSLGAGAWLQVRRA